MWGSHQPSRLQAHSTITYTAALDSTNVNNLFREAINIVWGELKQHTKSASHPPGIKFTHNVFQSSMSQRMLLCLWIVTNLLSVFPIGFSGILL